VDVQVVLDNWVERRAGGVCFEITELFGLLLRRLDYRAYPVLASSSFPGSHQALVVELTGTRYLVDVGCGAPFFDPVPLVGAVDVRRSGLAYRFRPDTTVPDGWCQERWIDNTWVPYMRYDLCPAAPAARDAAYQRHHTPGQSWVVDSLRMVRCEHDQVCVLRDGQLTSITAGEKHVEPIADCAAYLRVAAEVFGLPRLPIAAGLDALKHAASSV
jgi:arylamine N-acetyltransferase